MPRLLITLLTVVSFSPAALAAGEMGELPRGDIPPILYANLEHVDSEYPIFVSAEAMVLPSGELDLNLFHPHRRLALDKILHSTPPAIGRCVEWGPDYQSFMDPPRRDSIAAAVKSSDLVFTGRIVAHEYGVDRGTPGQLFRVEPLDLFRGKVALDHYFFFLPVGEFTAGSFHICKTDPRYPEPPRVGEQVILMVPETYSVDEPYLDLQFDTGLIIFDEHDQPRLPAALVAGEPLEKSLSRSSILEQVRAAASRVGPDS